MTPIKTAASGVPTASTIDAIKQIPLARRDMLKGAGLIFGTLAFTSPLAMLAPSRSWALELKRLESHQGDVLLAMTRRIYPHEKLDNAVYALVVKDLDGKASGDAGVQDLLSKGVRTLDALANGDWLRRAPNDQDHDISGLSGTAFFEAVRSTAVVSLYSNQLAFKHFGYGAQDGDGGYLTNGFNDLSWLPNPSAQDDGPVPAN